MRAVRGTRSWVVRWGGRTVQGFYSSSSGGHTSSNAQWGSAPLPYYPSRRDPYDRGGGAHPNPNSSWTVRISAASLGARVGVGTAVSVREVKPPPGAGGSPASPSPGCRPAGAAASP